MTIIKEIRGVAIQRFLPSGMDLTAWLDHIEAKRHRAVIRFQKDNPYDSTCMVMSVDDVDVCYVNSDDKRFVKPLIEKSGCEECMADFLEVYRPENGTPILRYTVVVDLDDVEKIVPGEEWSEWDYTGPLLLSIGKINNAEHYYNSIKKAILGGTDGICDATARLIDEFVEATLIDMSIETTKLYDDLLFLLETRQRNAWREYINIWVISGYSIMVLSLLINLWAIHIGVLAQEVSIIECINYLLIPLGAWWIFKEPITRRKMVAIGIIIVGVIVFFL